MKIGALVALLLLALAGAAAYAAPPKAPATAQELREYRDSGEWGRDISAVVKRAKSWIARRTAAERAPRKPALVLDIDETSLDNYPCMERQDFEPVLGALVTCWVRFDVPAIRQTRSLYRMARRRKVAVFFITGRRDQFRRQSRANLRAAGYARGFELVTRPEDDHEASVVPHKRSARRAIQRRGFKILANVGDQRSDLRGGYAERRFLIPNPMYVLP